jgi:3-methylfumaryl-CoA hydratase
MNFSAYRNWQAPQRKSEDRISLSPARRLLAALDRDPDALSEGDVLPLLWHWLYFLPAVPTARLAADGHPRRGGFMPPVDLPLRMFAGFELEVDRPLIIGEWARRTEQVAGIEEKKGKSGRLVFVTVGARIETRAGPAMREKQIFVYREAGAPVSRSRRKDSFPCDWSLETAVDRALLFRFSALTFNSHRIHYDRDYAVSQEGYPGLVVHGPLVAIFMAELVARNLPGRIVNFGYRQHAPLFEGDAIRIIGSRQEDGDLELRALNETGMPAATGRCRLG